MNSEIADAGAATLMFAEARESAAAVAQLLERNAETVTRLGRRLREAPPSSVMTIARGSSDNACTYGRYLIENSLGLVTASVGLSAGSVYRAPSSGAGALCIAVSQSGASPDLLAAVERAKSGGAAVVGLINQSGSPLAELCDEIVTLEAAPEVSVAATKSFISSLAAFAWIIGEWAQDEAQISAVRDLPRLLVHAWDLDWSPMVDSLRAANNLYVLGRGPGLGAAQEAALKLKETCGLHAEAISSAEVVHGPMALVKEGFPILALTQSDASLTTSRATAQAMAERGATVLVAGSEVPGTVGLPTLYAHPAIEPILMTEAFYRAAANLSVQRGYDPDNPPHLAKVTRTH